MNNPLVSVVVETINARSGSKAGSLVQDVQRCLAGIAGQTYPRERIEPIIVLDPEISADAAAELDGHHYPGVRFVNCSQRNYFAAKNAGAAAATGEIIALLDSDCEPSHDWLEMLLSRFDTDIGVVAGRVRYAGRSLMARTFSIPFFAAYVLGDENDNASGFNLSNVAFRRDVLIEHPFDSRIRRNGGCYFLFHQLRAAGIRVIFEPRATVAHRVDIRGLRFFSRYFGRGYDGVDIYRLDDGAVLKGTKFFRRTGAVGLIAIYGRRIVMDWLHLIRRRRRIGVPALLLPYFAAVTVLTRLIEFAGALAAAVAPKASR
jgi:glycosyltransferase involved in cell wall biosynthesis